MKHPLILLAVTMVTALAFTTQPNAPTPPRTQRAFDGHIESWLVQEDGTLLVRLMPADGKQSVWLRTPANQSSTTQFELLALHATLALDGAFDAQPRLTHVRGDASTEDDGSSAEHAMQLVAIGLAKKQP